MTHTSVEPVGPADVESLGSLVAASPFKPYRFMSASIGSELAAFWLRSLVEQARSGGALLGLVDGRPAALAVYAPRPWESRVSGRRIYGLEDVVGDPTEANPAVLDLLVSRGVETMQQLGAEAIHCKRPTLDMAVCHALERSGFLLMDTQLVYAVNLDQATVNPQTIPGVTVRPATAADTDALVRVAHVAFRHHFGRFNADSRFLGGFGEKAYEEWIRSGIVGYADLTLAAELDRRIIAYSMWRNPSAAEAGLSVRVGHYSIGAVDPEFSGRGLFTLVTARGMAMLKERADYLEGPTHVNNYGVQRGYARLGWRIVDARYAFHKWLDRSS